ncbi:MAG: CinA family protein [Rhodospirillaceae bacterium]|jgi:nicotinamide-nucleotide amidase|nr:CinA family protein [Rhodospirillaceae bacterium]MBT4940386.1 CinA family protein [Rhodospirillaceae bacterium]MBT7954055.1 CinA family protein [Rhodospirillaceae bacterium]
MQLSNLAGDLGALLKQYEQTISVAESSSGGLISAALLAVPGASAYFVGGGVIYTRDARREFLELPDEVVTMRAATEEYAMIVAQAVRAKMNTTWGLAETGASGPSGNRYGDDAGHVCVALAGPVDKTLTLETGSAEREENMWAFTKAALGLLEEAVRESAE